MKRSRIEKWIDKRLKRQIFDDFSVWEDFKEHTPSWKDVREGCDTEPHSFVYFEQKTKESDPKNTKRVSGILIYWDHEKEPAEVKLALNYPEGRDNVGLLAALYSENGMHTVR